MRAAERIASSRRSAVFALVALCLIWGYGWIMMKQALLYAGPFYFSALRTAAATAVLFCVMFALRSSFALRAPGAVLIIALFQTTGFILLTMLALRGGSVSKVSVLNFTMPFWVVVLAWHILGEKVRGAQWLAVALAAVGLIFVVEPWKLTSVALHSLFAVGAGLCWAAATIAVKHYRDRLRMEPLALTAWQMLFGTLPLVVIAWLVPERESEWNWHFAGIVVYLSALSTAGGWFLWLFILNRLPAGVASLNTLAIPALAVVFAWLQLGEQPDRYEILGMLLIAAALALLARLSWRR